MGKGHYRTPEYLAFRRVVAEGLSRCWVCGRKATQVDHIPPLRTVREGERWHGRLLPVCRPCNAGGAGEKLYGYRRDKKARNVNHWSRQW